jgi:hypothetical protein
VFNKKPWSDALFPDFDDSFESRFYCFGGDGGGNKGGGGTPPPKENVYNPEDQEPERGRPTTTAPPPQKAEVYTGPFTSQIAEDIYKSGPERPPTDVQKGFGIADIAPQAVVGVGDVIDKKRLDNKTLASFPPDKNVMSSGLQRASSDIFRERLGEDRSKFDSQEIYEEAIQGPPERGFSISPTGTLEDPGAKVTYTTPLQDLGLGNLFKNIALQDPKERARDKAAFEQNVLQLEAPKIEDRGSLYGRSFEIPVRQKSLYEGFADPMYGITLDDIVSSNPSVNLSDLQDSDVLGNPFAGTTGAFVPQRVIVGEDGKVTTIPLGFAQGGIVSLLEPLGDYLGNQIDQQRVDPFLEMVENAAYQEFGIDPSSGGGGMGSVGFDLPGETFGPGQMEPQVGGFLGRPALGLYATATTGQEQMTRLLGAGPNIGNETVQPDFMQSALGYFGETYDTFNADTGMSSTAMTPELMVQRAQSRLMQQDLKPKAETDYLNNIIQTGGNPTMMAPDMSGNMQQLNLLEVGPGGGVSSGQALPSTNPYQAQLQSAFGGIGSLF